jgi:transposase-like protein
VALIAIRCPHCDGEQVIKRGKTAEGKQRYRCQNAACAQRSFLLEYRYRAHVPEVKRQIVEMAMNGRGIRDTARVLRISKDTVLSALKKRQARLGP